MADVQIAVIDPEDTQLALAAPAEAVVNVAVPGVQGPIGLTGSVAIAQDGTATEPGIRFESDTNTGIYRPGADQLAISTNGTGRLTVGTTAVSSTLAVDHPLGAVGTPSITFTGDLNTGFWSPSADAIAASTGGSERLRIDSSGRLGLGTSSPSQILGITTATNDDGIILTNSSANGARIRLASTGTGGRAYHINVTADGSGAGGGRFVIRDNTASDAARLTIDSSGRVGIGTTSPSQLLSLSAASVSSLGASLIIENTESGSQTSLVSTGTAFSQVGWPSVADGVILRSGGNASGGLALAAGAEASIQFHTGSSGTERARIDSSGRLLVGASTAIQSDNNALVQLAAGVPTYVFGSTPTSGIVAGNNLGLLRFYGNSGGTYQESVRISVLADGAHALGSKPGRLVFSTTADGAASPTERLRITSAGVLQVADAGNITVGTTTGTKIGTATTQKIGFYDATPVVQPTAVADATDAVDVITQLNALLTRMRNLGLIAT
jgi:hypothetical protein